MLTMFSLINQKKNLTITEDRTIKDALIKINKNLQKCLIVVDKKNRLKGAITDGNIRRGFLAGLNLNSKAVITIVATIVGQTIVGQR